MTIPRYQLVHASQHYRWFPNAPTYGATVAALDAMQAPGQWIGAPRVVRSANNAAWHFARVRDMGAAAAQGGPELVAELHDATAAAMHILDDSDGWEIDVAKLDPGIHGDVAWWQSGAAAQTQTRDDFPQLFGRFDPDENPTGPTSIATHPRAPLDGTGAVGGSQTGGSGLLWGVALLTVAGGGALWLANRPQAVRIDVATEKRGTQRRA